MLDPFDNLKEGTAKEERFQRTSKITGTKRSEERDQEGQSLCRTKITIKPVGQWPQNFALCISALTKINSKLRRGLSHK